MNSEKPKHVVVSSLDRRAEQAYEEIIAMLAERESSGKNIISLLLLEKIIMYIEHGKVISGKYIKRR